MVQFVFFLEERTEAYYKVRCRSTGKERRELCRFG